MHINISIWRPFVTGKKHVYFYVDLMGKPKMPKPYRRRHSYGLAFLVHSRKTIWLITVLKRMVIKCHNTGIINARNLIAIHTFVVFFCQVEFSYSKLHNRYHIFLTEYNNIIEHYLALFEEWPMLMLCYIHRCNQTETRNACNILLCSSSIYMTGAIYSE